MVGRDVIFEIEKAPAQPGRAVLQVRDLTVADDRGVMTVNGLDFEVRAGEIFGIAGVEGNGQRELVEAIAGHASHVGRHASRSTAHDVTGSTPAPDARARASGTCPRTATSTAS